MKMKKTFALSLLCGSLCLASPIAHAAEFEGPDNGIQQTVISASDGRTRASWGKGILTHANPLGRKPWAYATSKTHAGNCHTIRARTSVVSGGYADYTSWNTQYNASSATSGTLIARTESSVTFNGEHEFRDSASSAWQYARTSASY